MLSFFYVTKNIPIRFQNRAKELGLFHKHERAKVLTELYYEFVELKKKKRAFIFSILAGFFWVGLGIYIGFKILMWLGDELTQISLTSINYFLKNQLGLRFFKL